MHFPRNLLDRPAEETARLIGLAFLDHAALARKRLRNREAEALHDFRVGARRLRTGLRCFRRELGRSVSRKSRRQLRRVARASNASRDLEVHLDWAQEQLKGAGSRQRAGVAWLVNRLAKRKDRSDRQLETTLRRIWPSLRRRLKKELGTYRRRVRVDRIARGHTAAPALGRQILQLAGELETRLAAIHSIGQRDTAHAARIQVKRLRYMLEPLEHQLEGAGALISGLKSLQDLLGDLHDAQAFMIILAKYRKRAANQHLKRQRKRRGWRSEPWGDDWAKEDDPRPGLLALHQILSERSHHAYHQLEEHWLKGAGETFFARVTELGQSLVRGDRDTLEIERKYLLRGVPPAARVVPPLEIEQGYLPGSRIADRVRRVSAGKEEHRYRTIKGGSGISRLEVEEEVPSDLYDHLWPLTEGRRVFKRRHQVSDGGLVWEIDNFSDRDLVLAEVELPTEAAPVETPEWLKPYVVREVTGEEEYANANLAR